MKSFFIGRKLHCCLLSILFIILGLKSQAQVNVSDWKQQKSLDGSCSIYAPEKMATRIDSLETDIGKVITVHHFLQQSTEISPNFLFQMSYTLYPSGMIPADSIEMVRDLLETTVDNAVLLQNGELIYKAEKSYKDYPGMIWKTKYNDGAYQMKSEIFWADNHMFLIQVASLSEFPQGKAVDHFFNSFKIE